MQLNTIKQNVEMLTNSDDDDQMVVPSVSKIENNKGHGHLCQHKNV